MNGSIRVDNDASADLEGVLVHGSVDVEGGTVGLCPSSVASVTSLVGGKSVIASGDKEWTCGMPTMRNPN